MRIDIRLKMIQHPHFRGLFQDFLAWSRVIGMEGSFSQNPKNYIIDAGSDHSWEGNGFNVLGYLRYQRGFETGEGFN